MNFEFIGNVILVLVSILRIRKRLIYWFFFNEIGYFFQSLKIDLNEEFGSSMKENIGFEDDENIEINLYLCFDKRKG